MVTGTTKCRQVVAPIVGIVLGLLLLAEIASAESDIFSPHSKPFHKTFPQWSTEWWQFVLSFPTSENPLLDSTGERCAIGQHGPVWFLMGTLSGSAERRCSVPAHTALFFPVVNLVNLNTTTQTAGELRAEIASCFDGVTALSVEVDGTPVKRLQKNPDRFRVKSVDVMLKPLDVGNHLLRFRGESPCGFSVDVTYHLTAVPVNSDSEEAKEEAHAPDSTD